jgi:hypothetical protein
VEKGRWGRWGRGEGWSVRSWLWGGLGRKGVVVVRMVLGRARLRVVMLGRLSWLVGWFLLGIVGGVEVLIASGPSDRVARAVHVS